jgi:MFS transporter, putative metabolite:H+ symporter
MASSVNAGARLDRLPIGPFHHRILILIGIGMFFDGFDIYIAGTVLGVTLKSGFSTLQENALFVSITFVGMMLGSFGTGFLGDRYGRRFTYQFNLMMFGLASLAAAFAPNMMFLIACRFVMGVGLGAENVVGYSTMTEFAPARVRGKYLGLMAVCVVTGLPIALLLASLVIPQFGWRAMFVIGGIGAMIVWYLRKSLPESPRWLEAVGRTEEAEVLLQSIEIEAARGRPLPPPAPPSTVPVSSDLATLFAPPLLSRMIVGSICLITINTLLYGFVTWLPVFFIKQGLSVATSFGYSLLMALGAPIGSGIGALTADRWGRKPTIIGASLVSVIFGILYPMVSDPVLLPVVGFALTVPIYVLVALLFGVYIPELFPTEVRLRASGLVNTLGRGATIVTPFIVVALFEANGIAGVMALMVGLLLLQIVAVWAFGIEPKNRSLEQLKGGQQPAPEMVARARAVKR